MLRSIAAAAFAACLLPLSGFAQTPPAPSTSGATPPATAAPDARPAAKPEAPPEAGKTYVPGVEQFMGVILSQHAKLWYAYRAKNWELAEFELGEIKEVMGDIQDLVPKFKNLPLADMLDAVILKEIADLEKAIAAKDSKAFAAGYDKLTAACNSCHEVTENKFVVIRRPQGNRPFPNQDFRPRK